MDFSSLVNIFVQITQPLGNSVFSFVRCADSLKSISE